MSSVSIYRDLINVTVSLKSGESSTRIGVYKTTEPELSSDVAQSLHEEIEGQLADSATALFIRTVLPKYPGTFRLSGKVTSMTSDNISQILGSLNVTLQSKRSHESLTTYQREGLRIEQHGLTLEWTPSAPLTELRRQEEKAKKNLEKAKEANPRYFDRDFAPAKIAAAFDEPRTVRFKQ